MELFERVRYISIIKDVSLAKVAKELGLAPQTFHHWLDIKSQRNLWEHLPKILEMFPDVRPEWLYMDQGPALHDGTGPETPVSVEVQCLVAKVAELEAELRESDRLNRQLTTRLLMDGVGDKDAAKSTGKASGGAK